jgi:hypothetical protein
VTPTTTEVAETMAGADGSKTVFFTWSVTSVKRVILVLSEKWGDDRWTDCNESLHESVAV